MRKGNGTTAVDYSAGTGTWGIVSKGKKVVEDARYSKDEMTFFSGELSRWNAMGGVTSPFTFAKNDDLLVNRAEDGHTDIIS